MKDYVLLNYDYLFSDHMAKCSHQAKLYYIKLMFFANNGFVANPLEVLDTLGYDKGVFYELVENDDLLTLPGRSEVFITAYFIHTRFKPLSWLSSPFAVYWKGKLFIKKNGVATFTPQIEEKEETKEPETKKEKMENVVSEILKTNEKSWDQILDDIETP